MAVTDPYGTVNTTTLGGGSGQDSKVTSAPSGGGALRTITTAWSSGNNPTVSSVTTTLNDSGEQSMTAYLYDAYANVTETQEYDYGLVYRRRAVTTYDTNPNYINAHILNLPTQVNLYDETGGTEAIKARTDYLYDETALQGYTPTPTQLDSSVTAYRGNVTTVKRYEDPTNLSTAISRSSTYDVAGNRVTASLDCCNTRTWTYDSSTQFSYPIASISGPVGTQLSVSATYYPENGQVHTSTDENGQVTTYTYDSSYRLTDVLRPDGIHYGTSYDDAAAFPSVITTSPTDSQKTAVAITTLDGAGHAIQRTVQDGAGNVISVVDMAYDNLGRRVQVSLPHASGASASYTTTSYDSLGRTAQVIPPDGTAASNNVTYSYSGSAITATDPANKQRKTYNDAFGRIRQVDEPGGTLSSVTITISGTEQVCSSGCGNGGPLYDTGSVGITVNGVGFSVDYGQGSTSLAIASALASGLSASANSAGFSVSQSGTRLTFTSFESGSDTNYAFSAGSNTTLNRFFTHPSFSPSPTTGTLSGGSDTTANPSLSAPFSTFYSYDAMDHLVLVKQGLQQRIYVYNGVGRLLSQQTPEGGPVTFAYTTSGAACSTDLANVCGRTDARGLSTTYTYDGLNRLKTVTYPAGTPSVALNYDAGGAAAFALGRLTSMSDGTGSETYTYNQLGRTTKVAKAAGSSNYNVSYVYNYIGEVKSLTYPSSRVVTQTYDSIGRTAQISSGGTNYLTVPSNGLTPAGLPTAINYGNGVTAALGYNARLQLSTLDYTKGATDLLNLTYNYNQTVNGQTVNNGQIQGITDTRGVAFSTSYAYDGLGRLQQAQTLNLTAANTWNLQWSYDRYGNRPTQTLLAGTISVTQPQLSISRTTNRISTAGYAYDANGNMTNDSIHAYAFDAENRLTTVDAGQANTSAYSYDGKGMRVKKAVTVGSSTTTTVYVFSGSKVIAEYVGGALSNEYVYTGGLLLATISSGGAVKYRHPDHVAGRLETDASGVGARTFGQLPFGETWYETGATSKWKFNTYERDVESGLDYATFRYDASRLGRFMTPDPLGGGLGNPQSLNKYVYVGNDPVNAVDPLGLSSKLYLYEKVEVRATVEDVELIEGGGSGEYLDGVYVGSSGGTGGQSGGSGSNGSGSAGATSGSANANKQKVLRRLLNPKCAALFGGLANALKALSLTQYLPFSQAPEVAQNLRKKNPLVNAYTESHTTYHIPQSPHAPPAVPIDVTTYLVPGFFDQQSQNDQEVEQLHELLHGVGYNGDDPSPLDPSKQVDPLDDKQRNDIDKLCPQNDVQTE